MKTMRTIFLVLVQIVVALNAASQVYAINGCGDALPPVPAYSDSTQWYVTNRCSDVDIFYIISTEIGDYVTDGTTWHYANTYNDSVRQPLLGEMHGVDLLVSGDLNFYSPYYRQCSLQSSADSSLMSRRMLVPLDDVRSAFHYYLQNLNCGRPFIIAGFSQGAMIALQLLKEMDTATAGRLVAAFIIGATISKEDLDSCSAIKPAQDATDTGVTICYNSVRDRSCAIDLMSSSAVAINPVNWKTDTTAATLVTEPSPLNPAGQTKDTLTVRLDVASGLLLVDGFAATDYVLPLIGKEGCYHSREIWLYRDYLRQNMATRAAAYLRQR